MVARIKERAKDKSKQDAKEIAKERRRIRAARRKSKGEAKPMVVINPLSNMKTMDDLREEINNSSPRAEVCFVCGKEIRKSSYGNICGDACLEYGLEYNRITIPVPFVKRLYFNCKDSNERNKQLGDFAKRHGYDREKVIRKARSVYQTNFCKGE